METLLVRMKPYDPQRGFVLRRFTYRGVRFQPERGWYRVQKDVGEYLKGVRQGPERHAPLAFDVCTEEEATTLEARERAEANPKKSVTDELTLSPARAEEGLVADALAAPREDESTPRRGRKERV